VSPYSTIALGRACPEMEGLRTALCSVRVPSLVQMRSADYWRSLLTNKGGGTGGGSGASHKNGGAFFGTFEVT
jgi:hypothetical protein